MGRLLQDISAIPYAFGGASISGEGGGYGFGNISEVDAISLLNVAFERGVKVFDTAPIYGFGLSEMRIGKAFKSKREKVFLISKSGVTWDRNKRVDMSNDPSVTKRMLEQSLRNLNSDYIDLYMVHWPDSKVDIRHTMEVLAKAKLEGKIKHLGLCNTTIEDLDRALEVDFVEVVQSELNIFNRQVVENLFPYLRSKNISFMSWGTLDKGILTKKVDAVREQRKDYDTTDCRRSAPWWKQSEVVEKVRKLEEVWPLLEKEGISPLEFAMGFNLSFEEVDMALVGAKNIQQLEDVLKSLEVRPSQALVKEVLELV